MLIRYTTLVLQVACLASCDNILAIVPTPSYSHQVAFFDLWMELSLRGHKVTVVTTDPQKNEKLTNLTEIDVKFTYEYFADISKMAEKNLNMWNMHAWFNEMSYKLSVAQLSHDQIQDLIHDKSRHFDVVLVESLYPEFLGFAELYNCPSILICSMDAFINIHHKMGNTAHSILYPSLGASLHYPLNFKERVISTIYSLYSLYFYDYIGYPSRNKLIQKFFNSTSSADELLNKIDMLFLTVNPIIQPIRAVGPTTINIGGLRTISTKPLPKDLAEFLNSATNGFVYFSLGSNVKSKDLENESLIAIIDTLEGLPYKVLWKFEAEPEDLPRKPENIKLIKWAPQNSILAHPNIKLFITQGGLQSMEESIHSEVPTVVIPFFGDQEQNARLMKNKGISVVVGRQPHIKKEELTDAIFEVINNPKYKKTVKNLNKLSQDTPMSGLERAIWWTEYVIRNKGAKHLRNPAADISFYQYYLLDVIGFLISVIFVTLSVFIFALRKVNSIFITPLLQRSALVNKKLQ